jgi:hypothetical protein
MGEVITPEAFADTLATRTRRAEEHRQRAAEDRTRRQAERLASKKDRLSVEDRRKIARNLGQLVEETAESCRKSPPQMIRDLFEKYDVNLLAKRRRIILLKREVPPSGTEALAAMLKTYLGLAKALAEMHPRAALDIVSIKQRYEQRLVAGTTLSIDSESNGGLVDVEAIGGVTDLLGDATKLLKAKVPRLIEHFEALALSRVMPTMKSIDFDGNEARCLTPLNNLGPMVVDSSDDFQDEEGVLTLNGFDEAFYLSEDEFEIEHHWPSTRLGHIIVTKKVATLYEDNTELKVIAEAYRDHPDWELLSKADKIDLEGKHNGSNESWLADDGRGHFIDSEVYKDCLGALSSAVDKLAKEGTKSWYNTIERRFSLHLCVYPIRVSGQTDFRFGLYLSGATTPVLGCDPLFDAGGYSLNVALACEQKQSFKAIRASEVQALDDYLGVEERWSRGDYFPTIVAPLNSPSAINWLGGRTFDWAMSENPRSDRFKEGVVVVFKPTFYVPDAPASAPLATPAGMIERNILHDASGDDVLSRLIQDAEARIEWFDGVQASWAEIHRQAREKFAQKISAAVENADITEEKED